MKYSTSTAIILLAEVLLPFANCDQESKRNKRIRVLSSNNKDYYKLVQKSSERNLRNKSDSLDKDIDNFYSVNYNSYNSGDSSHTDIDNFYSMNYNSYYSGESSSKDDDDTLGDDDYFFSINYSFSSSFPTNAPTSAGVPTDPSSTIDEKKKKTASGVTSVSPTVFPKVSPTVSSTVADKFGRPTVSPAISQKSISAGSSMVIETPIVIEEAIVIDTPKLMKSFAAEGPSKSPAATQRLSVSTEQVTGAGLILLGSFVMVLTLIFSRRRQTREDDSIGDDFSDRSIYI